uniref:Uncharacterized protein n=1 Tax=Varanus komodoensis TaxID=61221 RepID=A0A8D2JAV8_VARKO
GAADAPGPGEEPGALGGGRVPGGRGERRYERRAGGACPALPCPGHAQQPREPSDPGGPRRDFTAPAPESGPPSFEWLLGRLGAGGRRQGLLLALSCLPCVLLGLGLGSDALFTLTPPRHCRDANGTRLPENTTCEDPRCQRWDYGGLPALTSNPVTEVSILLHQWPFPTHFPGNWSVRAEAIGSKERCFGSLGS